MSNPFTTSTSHASLSTASHHGSNVFDPLAFTASHEGKGHKDVVPFGNRTDMTQTITSTAPTDSAKPSPQEQRSMMDSIIQIFHLEEEDDEEMRDEGEDEDGEIEVDVEDQMRRTEKLRGVIDILGKLWWARSEHFETVAEKLADGSRDRELFFTFSLLFLRGWIICKRVLCIVMVSSMSVLFLKSSRASSFFQTQYLTHF